MRSHPRFLRVLLLLAALSAFASAHAPSSQDAKATCLIFVLKDCPIANRYAPEIRRIVSDYGKRGIEFALVYEDSDITPAEAEEHAKQYRLSVPVKVDVNYALAKRRNVMVSPTAVVESTTAVHYVGRIDNTYVAIGKRRAKATVHDLRSALEDVLAGRTVKQQRTESIGCKLY